MSNFNGHITNEFDPHFETIPGIKYLPWIGKDFLQSKPKILLVGESHYIWGDSEAELIKNTEEANQPTFGRKVAYQHGIAEWNRDRNFIRGIERAIKGKKLNNQEEHKQFWESVAFQELVQRPMSSIKERPSNDDLALGSHVLKQIVQILQPEVCIYSGSQWNKFSILRDIFGTDIKNEEYLPKISRSEPKILHLDNSARTKIIFIRHPSAYFSHTRWHEEVIKSHVTF